MTSKLHTPSKAVVNRAHVVDGGSQPIPVWRASLRTVAVTTAGVVAAVLMAGGISGCADMSGIRPTAELRDASSLGLGAGAGASMSEPSTARFKWPFLV